MEKKIFIIILAVISAVSLSVTCQAHNLKEIKIENINSPPIIIEGSLNGETEVEGGIEYTYTARGYDPDGDDILFDFIWVGEKESDTQWASTQYPEDYLTFVESGPNNIVTATVKHTWPNGLLEKDYELKVVIGENNDEDRGVDCWSEPESLSITREGSIKPHFKNILSFKLLFNVLEKFSIF